MMHYTLSEIHSLLERFEHQELPKAEWSHEAHLAVAIYYSMNYGPEQAMACARLMISQHNQAVGTPNTDTEGYHESITQFWLLVAQAYLEHQGIKTLETACNLFIESPIGKSSFPLSYYSKERLFSVEARHTWVLPDLKDIEELKTDIKKGYNIQAKPNNEP